MNAQKLSAEEAQEKGPGGLWVRVYVCSSVINISLQLLSEKSNTLDLFFSL